MLKRATIGSAMMIMAGCAGGGAPIGPAAISQAQLPPDHYVVFFQPKALELDEDGQAIVRAAVADVEERRPSKIEIVMPANLSGAPDVVKARYAVIQNIMSESGMDAAMDSRVVLASDPDNVPGADDRAEIRLMP